MTTFADKRAHGIALLREYARHLARSGKAAEAYRGLLSGQRALMQEFMTEFDVAGTRYWHLPEKGLYVATGPGEECVADEPAGRWIELARYEFLSRQGLHSEEHIDEDRL